jgi:hypothetical protein
LTPRWASFAPALQTKRHKQKASSCEAFCVSSLCSGCHIAGFSDTSRGPMNTIRGFLVDQKRTCRLTRTA